MAISDTLKALVDQMPDPDDRGMYTKNIDKEKIEKAVAAIIAGGRANVQGLIEMLGEPGSEENVKPHYALHCVLNRTLILKDQKARKDFCETLAKNLAGGLSTYNKAYLCQELQWAGGREAVPALGKLLTDEELCDPAGMALVAIRDGAAEQFAAALPRARGRCRLAIVHGLAALADERAVGILMQVLNDPDRDTRLAAGDGLAKIGHPGCVGALVEAADGAAGWERIKATRHCLILAERLLAGGKKKQAMDIYRLSGTPGPIRPNNTSAMPPRRPSPPQAEGVRPHGQRLAGDRESAPPDSNKGAGEDRACERLRNGTGGRCRVSGCASTQNQG